MSETKLRKANKFLKFYFSPWDTGKAAKWEQLTKDKEFNVNTAHNIVMQIMAGVEDLDWTALDG